MTQIATQDKQAERRVFDEMCAAMTGKRVDLLDSISADDHC